MTCPSQMSPPDGPGGIQGARSPCLLLMASACVRVCAHTHMLVGVFFCCSPPWPRACLKLWDLVGRVRREQPSPSVPFLPEPFFGRGGTLVAWGGSRTRDRTCITAATLATAMTVPDPPPAEPHGNSPSEALNWEPQGQGQSASRPTPLLPSELSWPLSASPLTRGSRSGFLGEHIWNRGGVACHASGQGARPHHVPGSQGLLRERPRIPASSRSGYKASSDSSPSSPSPKSW